MLMRNDTYQVLDAVDAKVEWTTYDGWGVYFPDGYFRFNVGPADQPGENQEAALLSAPIMQYSVSATQTACAPAVCPLPNLDLAVQAVSRMFSRSLESPEVGSTSGGACRKPSSPSS